MGLKANGIYTDGNVDSLKHSGVQPWSAGEEFPYVVFKREHYHKGTLITEQWVVTYAGVELTKCETQAEANELATVFKRAGVKDRFDANWHQAVITPAMSSDPFTQRCAHDDRVMYPDGKPEAVEMGTPEWYRQRAEGYQPYESNKASGGYSTRDRFGWDRELSAMMSRARADFYSEDS